ncbi:MAG TPA: sugar phosphate isomerase/epimerase [Acidobacteriaceae bacterium]|nr:sugar phosphate isomerase/epimerase [Acidobacteriaceae bacterium]
MAISRREFLARLAASGAVAALPGYAHAGAGALYPPMDLSSFDHPLHHGGLDLKIGYSSITWNEHDRQAMEDLASLGYPGIQIRSNVLKVFPDPHELRDLLAQHHLKFVALSSGNATLDRAARQSTIETHVQHAIYLRDAGGSYLQLVGGSVPGANYSAADYKYEGELMAEIGKHAAEHGIRTGFHNHMGTIGQTPEAVDAILAAADANYLKLELDVAHYLQGGGDPASAIHKYGQRILFLHLKDVKSAENKNGYEFVELGQGRVDFPAILDALRAIHFRGWAIVELDRVPAGADRTPKESAEMSKNYLEQKLGVHV